jgi:hypothetical protein
MSTTVGLYVYGRTTVLASSDTKMTLVRCDAVGGKMKRRDGEDVGLSWKETLDPGLYGLFSTKGIEITRDGSLIDLTVVTKEGKDPWPVPLATRPSAVDVSGTEWEDFHAKTGVLARKFLFTQGGRGGRSRGSRGAPGTTNRVETAFAGGTSSEGAMNVFAVLYAGDIDGQEVLVGARDAVSYASAFLQDRFELRLAGTALSMGQLARAESLHQTIVDVAGRAKAGDTCVIVFSGHGAADGALGWQLFEGVYEVGRLAKALGHFRDRVEVLIVGDCCYSLEVFKQFLPDRLRHRFESLPAPEFAKAVRRLARDDDPRRRLLQSIGNELMERLQSASGSEGTPGVRPHFVFAAAAGFKEEFLIEEDSRFVRALVDSFVPGNPADPATYSEVHDRVDTKNPPEAKESWTLFASSPDDMTEIRPLRT